MEPQNIFFNIKMNKKSKRVYHNKETKITAYRLYRL